MHDGNIGLSVIGVVVVAVLRYGPLVVALAVIIDAVRRPPVDLTASIPGGLWTWIAPNIAFLSVMILDYAGVRATVLAYAIVVLYAIIAPLDFAYLLRVVFPSPARRAARG